MVRSAGAKVVTSADLVQKYEACWSKEQLDSHMAAGVAIDRIVREAFSHAAQSVREKKSLTEYDLKEWLLLRFAEAGIVTDEGPDVADQCQCQRSALCGDAREGRSHSRRRPAAARRLGQAKSRGERLLRRDLGRLPWCGGSGKVCENLRSWFAKPAIAPWS